MKRVKQGSVLKKQRSITEYIHKQSENGPIQVKSLTKDHQPDKGESLCVMDNNKEITQTIDSKQSIAEYQAQNKETISQDKYKQCKQHSQTTESTKTSVQASTSKGKTCSPFWTHHCQEWSKKLLSRAEIGSVDLHSNSTNGSLLAKEQGLSSWSNTTNHLKASSQATSCPSFKFSAVGEMAQDVTIPKIFKVKLNPTTKQKRQLRTWEGGYRFSYNKALDMKRNKPKLSKFDLRTLVVTKTQNKKTMESGRGLFGDQKDNPFLIENKWLSKVPKDIRQQAAFELFKNFKQHKGNVTYKDKRKDGWVIGIENHHVSCLDNGKIRLYSKDMKVVLRTFGSLPSWLKPSEFEDEVSPPCQALIEKRGQGYYMLFPQKEIVQRAPDVFEGHMVGIDPGIRKFLTCYGTDGRNTFIGCKNPMRKFLRLQWYADYVKNKLYSPKKHNWRPTGKERKKLKNKSSRIQERLENIRKDFHHKSAKWLTDKYKCIIIGKLPKGIISRDRSLPKSVKRAFNNLAHFKFRCCLQDKCRRKGVIYHEINEAYTSKTCTCCGKLNNVGSNEVYNCDCQDFSWDRDVNGARNILLKGISESFLRIVVRGETLSLQNPCGCLNPRGYSLGLNILKEC